MTIIATRYSRLDLRKKSKFSLKRASAFLPLLRRDACSCSGETSVSANNCTRCGSNGALPIQVNKTIVMPHFLPSIWRHTWVLLQWSSETVAMARRL